MNGRRWWLGLVCCALLCGGARLGLADQTGFPFDGELILDADPMPGSKRIPNMDIAANGTLVLEMWCNRVEGQVVVAADTITVITGQPTQRQCTPDRERADAGLIEALTAVTNWRRQGDFVVPGGRPDAAVSRADQLSQTGPSTDRPLSHSLRLARASNPITIAVAGRGRPASENEQKAARGEYCHGRHGTWHHIGLVLEPLESARSRPDRHDGDLQPAICLDAVHRPAQPEARNDARRIAVDVLAADHPADLVLAVAGLSGRPLRPAAPDLGRRAVVRRRLGAVELCRQPLGAVLHLRRHLRLRHRHHLCRHHRPDGALVPGPARACDRPCRRGLWLWRVLHQLPDRQHDQELGLCAHARRVGHHPGRHRRRRRAMAARAARGLAAGRAIARRPRTTDADRTQLHAAGDAAEPGLLAAVHHDEHDVDQRA